MNGQRRLSLHHLTALDVSPAELIRVAHAVGCAQVGLFVHVPERARGHYPPVDAACRDAVLTAQRETGVTPHNVEVFPLGPDTDMEEFHRPLAMAAELGAAQATAHLHFDNPDEGAAALAAFGDLAAAAGLRVGLEFNGFTKVRTLAAAASIVQRAARPNVGIVLDVLHAMRNGVAVADVKLAAHLLSYAQICDAPAEIPAEGAWYEAVRERLLPGQGCIPIASMLAPLAPDVVIDVEVPQAAAGRNGAGALERARAAVEAARRVLATIS